MPLPSRKKNEVVEEVFQVDLEGLVLRLRVGADVDAVGVHEDDAEDGGKEAEGERVRREDLSTEKLMPVALACCWMILVMMCLNICARVWMDGRQRMDG